MQRSAKSSLHIILALLLIIAPFQMAMSGDMGPMNHTPDTQQMPDMSNMAPDCQNCNTPDLCDSNSCSTDSCSFCSVAPALIPDHSFGIDHPAIAHGRFFDTTPPHWNTSPPIRPPWS